MKKQMFVILFEVFLIIYFKFFFRFNTLNTNRKKYNKVHTSNN